MSWIKTISVQLFIGFIFLEIFSYIGSKSLLFIVNDTPELYRSTESYHEGRTEREVWGTWQ